MSTLIPPSSCPTCGAILDAATGVKDMTIADDLEPKPGDGTVCFRCGGLAIFDKRLALRRPTSAERRMMLRKPEIIAIHNATRKQ